MICGRPDRQYTSTATGLACKPLVGRGPTVRCPLLHAGLPQNCRSVSPASGSRPKCSPSPTLQLTNALSNLCWSCLPSISSSADLLNAFVTLRMLGWEQQPRQVGAAHSGLLFALLSLGGEFHLLAAAAMRKHTWVSHFSAVHAQAGKMNANNPRPSLPPITTPPHPHHTPPPPRRWSSWMPTPQARSTSSGLWQPRAAALTRWRRRERLRPTAVTSGTPGCQRQVATPAAPVAGFWFGESKTSRQACKMEGCKERLPAGSLVPTCLHSKPAGRPQG